MVFGEHLLMDVEVHVCDYIENIYNDMVDSRTWKTVEVYFRPSIFVVHVCVYQCTGNIKE